MKLRVAFLLALALLCFGAGTIVGMNMPTPILHGVSYGNTMNVDTVVRPCGDPVEGPGFPH